MQRIVPNLWFNDNAEEAVELYKTAFSDVTVNRTDHYTDAGKEQHGHEAGQVMTVDFSIEGYRFVAINGGAAFLLNPAISFFVNCASKEDVDKVWNALSDGGTVLMALDKYPFSEYYGWVSDKFGVSWQVTLAEDTDGPKVFPSLLFTQDKAGKAEDAMNYYASVFPDSSVGTIARYGADQAPDKEGTVMYGEATILGEKLVCMDSALQHEFTFNPSVSLLVECQDQAEIDRYWEKLSAVPEAEACGWLQDKYGVSWQIAPVSLNDMLQNGTPEQIERVTAAYMQMKKFDIKVLEDAYNGVAPMP